MCSISAFCPTNLFPALLPILIKDCGLTAPVESGNSESYVNFINCSKLRLDVYPTTHQVQMTLIPMTIKSTSFTLVNISIKKTCYPSMQLNILESLYSDIILGLDFQSQDQNLVIKFDGESLDLVAAPQSHCSWTTAKTPEMSLFSNLSKTFIPMATKLHRNNLEAEHLSKKSVCKLFEDGIILPVSSPCRAQVLIVTDEFCRHKMSMYINYSQKINIYWARCLSVATNWWQSQWIDQIPCFFNLVCLQSAYHQVKIV